MESTEHIELKKQAAQWLTENGFVEVEEEFQVEQGRVDVVGREGDDYIAVECGNTPIDKLTALSSSGFFRAVLVWPYGSTEPQKIREPKVKISPAPGTALLERKGPDDITLIKVVDEDGACFWCSKDHYLKKHQSGLLEMHDEDFFTSSTHAPSTLKKKLKELLDESEKSKTSYV